MNRISIAQLGTICKRYGPGRLPRADQQTIGAGYALGAAALLSTVFFVSLSAVATVLGATDGLPLLYLSVGVVALPLVVVSAFFSGVVIWKVIPIKSPVAGGVGGFIATGLTYVVSTLLLFPIVLAVSYGEWYFTAAGAVAAPLFIGFAGALLTVWVTIPVGCASGYLYERVREEMPPSTAT